MKYQHVLFATDLSEASDSIAKKAKAIADRSQATLDIVHIIEHSPTAYSGEFSIPIDVNLEQVIEANARKALSQQAEQLNVDPDHQHMMSGGVKHSVLELAKQLKADLIIVGTHSRHGIEALLGSRANAILHGATCDVLSVRP